MMRPFYDLRQHRPTCVTIIDEAEMLPLVPSIQKLSTLREPLVLYYRDSANRLGIVA